MKLFVCKKHNQIKFSASQRISNMNCMNYDHNKKIELFKFRSIQIEISIAWRALFEK